MKRLKEYLTDWTDLDVAAYYLGVTLGIFQGVSSSEDKFQEFRDNKHIFWTNNTLGDLLYDTLSSYRDSGLIEIEDNSARWKGIGSLTPQQVECTIAYRHCL